MYIKDSSWHVHNLPVHRIAVDMYTGIAVDMYIKDSSLPLHNLPVQNIAVGMYTG